MYELKLESVAMKIKPLFDQLLILIKLRKLDNQIKGMQKQMIDKLVYKAGKVEVLTNYWDKLLGQMQKRCTASEKPDKHM